MAETMNNTQGQREHEHTNRLIHETSPYLLQHAHNPVDWYPWGEEALEKARRENKPIILSVGYSACHWCHVMEHESFENPEIAALMNQNFVPIKVDREERPDIDNIYMQAVQALTGQGGWPMTVFLTPDGRPFYGGTYYPPEDRHYGQQVMPGFRRVLLSMADVYKNRRADVEQQAAQLAQLLQQRSSTPLLKRNASRAGAMPLEALVRAGRELAEDFDTVNGGFSGAPKFPNTMSLEFLLRMYVHRQRGEISAPVPQPELEMVEFTLNKMANGGIYDHLGGGFHRYSVDAQWLVPHFEKMLYDNALLSRLYLHTYLVTSNPFYSDVVTRTLDYVVREMTSAEGGFYSTQDADSEGEEGKFYVWTPEEIEAALPVEDVQMFLTYYAVTPEGNFEGKNILHVPRPARVVADELGISLEVLQQTLERDRSLLFHKRAGRIPPSRDEKILTAWNGMMLRSFAEAGRYLTRPDYIQVAIRNADFLLTNLYQNGRLLRTYKNGRAHLKGYLEDYAFLIDGLLALYEASFDSRWFVEARRLTDEMIRLFADNVQGGFYDTGRDHEELVARPKDIMDNAVPAGNSVAAEVLLKLTACTGNEQYRRLADDYLSALADVIVQHPAAFGAVLCALDFALSSVKEIAIIGDLRAADSRDLLEVVNERYLPNSVLAAAFPTDLASIQAIPLLENRPMKGGKATAYVCQNFICLAPVTTPEELAQLL
ncbi:MAG TPA: thioredoxin domain-containing protein [Ktedonobacteraceae bacterium]|nr:thioredoxin domain-containing protein [Ktedonobacteraceae bacterium]